MFHHGNLPDPRAQEPFGQDLADAFEPACQGPHFQAGSCVPVDQDQRPAAGSVLEAARVKFSGDKLTVLVQMEGIKQDDQQRIAVGIPQHIVGS